MEHCEVKSVQGPWAMANYPHSIDLYYGKLVGSDKQSWEGFIVFGYPSEEPIFHHEKLKLYPVSITSETTARYAGDTAVGTSQKIKFRYESYDGVRYVSTYSLEYMKDSGLYECEHAWPVGLPH
jgi:hypothetical protein